jgi:hypothetical protein
MYFHIWKVHTFFVCFTSSSFLFCLIIFPTTLWLNRFCSLSVAYMIILIVLTYKNPNMFMLTAGNDQYFARFRINCNATSNLSFDMSKKLLVDNVVEIIIYELPDECLHRHILDVPFLYEIQLDILYNLLCYPLSLILLLKSMTNLRKEKMIKSEIFYFPKRISMKNYFFEVLFISCNI